jgi:hypothetical protein
MAYLTGAPNVSMRLVASVLVGGGMALLSGRGILGSCVLTAGIMMLAVSSGVATLWSG